MSGPVDLTDLGLSCQELEQRLAADSSCIVLIDCRPYSDYVVKHIASALSVRLSSILIRRLEKGSIKVADLLVDEQRTVYETHRDKHHTAVVYDQGSSGPDFETYDGKNAVHVVLKALRNEGVVCHYLDGGMVGFANLAAHRIEASTDVQTPSPFLNNIEAAPTGLALPPMEPPTPHHHARDLTPTEILPHLLVGAENHAADHDLLKSLRITAILNMTPNCPNHFEGIFEYKNIPVRDTWNQNLANYFEDAFNFINRCKENGGRVLIHCVAGISRSPSITIAYIMKENSISLGEAYAFVKNKRPSISPNLDFMGELQAYERKCLARDSPVTPLNISLTTSDEL
eukprot:m.27013 g.27013  ORF g.27013 m.27013 type:complete len:343 (+) comp4702_c0_seq1:881-1909(+)